MFYANYPNGLWGNCATKQHIYSTVIERYISLPFPKRNYRENTDENSIILSESFRMWKKWRFSVTKSDDGICCRINDKMFGTNIRFTGKISNAYVYVIPNANFWLTHCTITIITLILVRIRSRGGEGGIMVERSMALRLSIWHPTAYVENCKFNCMICTQCSGMQALWLHIIIFFVNSTLHLLYRSLSNLFSSYTKHLVSSTTFSYAWHSFAPRIPFIIDIIHT